EKIALLRSAARVVRTASEVGPAALAELADPEPLGDARRTVACERFFEPGTATERALAMVYDLLELPASESREAASRPHELRSSARPSFGYALDLHRHRHVQSRRDPLRHAHQSCGHRDFP